MVNVVHFFCQTRKEAGPARLTAAGSDLRTARSDRLSPRVIVGNARYGLNKTGGLSAPYRGLRRCRLAH